MTLVTISKEQFDSLDDERLGWICVEPTILQIRGKEFAVKQKAISGLNKGQQALLMFRVLYDHAKHSAAEYYAWISYLLATPGYWTGVLGSLQFFDDQSMLILLEDTKEAIDVRNGRLGVHYGDAELKDLDQDRELSQTMSLLFERFHAIVPDSLQFISKHIRANPQHFVTIDK
ncbi:hypothetical protein [Paenibacillus sp. GCM10027626]|uniref:hypothetical protein n=1 Tax=Paenibacillus sp. GCM10027626 TaxID=3273411 RepID=UPI0036252134